jgi:hypothetical protein
VASEDYELWLRAATAGLRLGRCSAPRLLYRRHPGQVTAQRAWRADRAATTTVEASFHALAEATLGFRPSWFRWRRDGLPPTDVPRGLVEELDAMESRARTLASGRALRPLLRRTGTMRAAAGAAAASGRGRP